ncbi:hypothetical protein QFC21_003407 [Naganishia friedmannii]|uniref:Uncharacterized protein n=1 Tax=Naganishia friedmannii TaxID=89922 RepID=A0ACC2VPT9_9TREE|nr:hypothetical protein QFC21_003407 [Naganishia friedmannii]
MSRQDRATTERNAKILRELIKQPDNKLCADCKKNVKSVDLDIWQPDQIEHVRKWGNRRANIYWEAHLKPGHVPPEHKIESFIRSKYESRRWAMRQAVPDDPAVLDTLHAGQQSSEGVDDGHASANARHGDEHGGARRTTHPLLSTSAAARATPTHRSHHQPPPYTTTAAPPKATSSSRPTPTPTFDLLGGDLTDLHPAATATATQTGPAPPVPGNRPTAAHPARSTLTQRQPELAAVVDTSASTTGKPMSNGGPPGAGAGAGAGLFDLDFRPPTSATSTSGSGFNPISTSAQQNQRPKSSMNDIMSLFSSSASPASASAQQNASLANGNGNGNGGVGGFGSHSYPQQQQQPQPQQYQSQAIYGAPGSSDAPPTLVSPGNGQTGYATWSAGANGITSTSPYAGGTGTAGLTKGMESMGLNAFGGGGGGGADVWASSSGNGAGHKVADHAAPSQPQPYTLAQPAATSQATPQPAAAASGGNSNNHYFSSADVWGTPGGGEANGSDSTYGNGASVVQSAGAGNTNNVNAISDDPFANIWK